MTVSTFDRAVTAAKQIAIALAGATLLWVLAAALAPDPTIDGQGARSLLTMPFVATCGAIVALFALNAFAFDQSQLATLGSRSLMVGAGAGAVWFVLGVLWIDTVGLAAVLHLFFAALLVAALVAAVGSACQLLVRLVTSEPASLPA